MRRWGAILGLVLGVMACATPPIPPPRTPSSSPDASSPAAGEPSSVAGPAAPDPRNEIRITSEAAIRSAREFTGEPLADATAELMEPGALSTAYMVAATGWMLLVDAFDGRVTVANRETDGASVGPAIDEPLAVARATAFLAAHRVLVPAVAPDAELVDHGSTRTWEVVWQVRSGQALAPDMRIVRVEAAGGAVSGMTDMRRPYAPAPLPALTKDQAIGVARVTAGLPDGVAEDVTLRIWFDDAGAQTLVWSVTVTGPPDEPHGAVGVLVDAMTGDASILGDG